MTREEIEEFIEELGYEDVLVFDDPSYTDAFVGVSDDGRAVYDYNKMVKWLMITNGMTEDEAVDFISYNNSFYSGGRYPIILYRITLQN